MDLTRWMEPPARFRPFVGIPVDDLNGLLAPSLPLNELVRAGFGGALFALSTQLFADNRYETILKSLAAYCLPVSNGPDNDFSIWLSLDISALNSGGAAPSTRATPRLPTRRDPAVATPA